jgi:hypothetical protein
MLSHIVFAISVLLLLTTIYLTYDLHLLKSNVTSDSLAEGARSNTTLQESLNTNYSTTQESLHTSARSKTTLQESLHTSAQSKTTLQESLHTSQEHTHQEALITYPENILIYKENIIVPIILSIIFFILGILFIVKRDGKFTIIYNILTSSTILRSIGYLLKAIYVNSNNITGKMWSSILAFSGFSVSLIAIVLWAASSFIGIRNKLLYSIVLPILIFGPILGFYTAYKQDTTTQKVSSWGLLYTMIIALLIVVINKQHDLWLVMTFIISIIAIIMQIPPIYYTMNFYYTDLAAIIPEFIMLIFIMARMH